MDNNIEIGKRIRSSRIQKGMTQTDLANKLQVSQGAVASWEAGLTFPRTQKLKQLSEELSLPIEDFFKTGEDLA